MVGLAWLPVVCEKMILVLQAVMHVVTCMFACSHLIACKYFLLLFLYIFYLEENNVQSRNTIFLIDCGTYVPLLKVPG